jgi:glycosyltransferase involved in cell wall biosynthesis
MDNKTMLPKVSILIPTLNAASVLEKCLKEISQQDYPKELIEIIIADGGSTDRTLEIARNYGALVVENKLKTGEAGKMAALHVASGEFCALIDSDNFLPDSGWLNQMVEPLLENSDVVGSEPWEYALRKEDGFIDRYCALIGMNDPLVLFLGNYDRVNTLSGKWTELPHDEEDKGNYLLCGFDKRGLPTIGANGTVFRTDFLKKYARGDYLFDIDILAVAIKELGKVKFIKVKNGIINAFCGSDIKKFARKQKRRIRDYLYHKKKQDRTYSWEDKESNNSNGMLSFVISCVTVIPLIVQAFRGYSKKADTAWFFHPLACEITLWEYGCGYLSGLFSTAEVSRVGWGQ